ncbi:MAG: hypothetical protein J7K34_05240 [Flavobacteriaceae bacterium]|nr:hypothetical protein [Flavobacteriaceae bacterium]
MKKVISLLLITLLYVGINSAKAQDLSPYIKVGDVNTNMDQTAMKVKSALTDKGFDIIGEYNVENNKNLKVIVYSRKDLQTTVLKVKDRGALAAALKVGLKASGSKITISYLNPEYLFNAYLRGDYSKHQSALKKVENDVKSALSALGNDNKGFGGSLSAKDLRKYHYKMMMPYFSDPVELEEFSSFEEGVSTIEKNLAAKKGNTKLVYKLKFSGDKVAVYGVALLDATIGEGYFLPIIDNSHLAAMPYEIILQGKTATILHGRYRLAVHWPELTMGTFMKIMSTPGEIEDTLEALCK